MSPLIADEHIIGALSVDSVKADAFDIGHRRLLSIMANQAAVAILKSRLWGELERAKEREKQMIRDFFQRYVSPTVVSRLVDDREALALSGKRQSVSVLFADVRGFTALSEHMAPERLIEVLNQYFALAVDAILAQGGTLDKFMGDAVMALFNAPLPQPDHTLRAVRAALSMQQAIVNHNLELEGEDYVPMSFGVGIHVGQAVVGNVGTVQQMNYTAIGDTVNLAERLQEQASRGQIILSQAAYEAVQEVVYVKALGVLTIKGKAAEERAYSLIGLAENN